MWETLIGSNVKWQHDEMWNLLHVKTNVFFKKNENVYKLKVAWCKRTASGSSLDASVHLHL